MLYGTKTTKESFFNGQLRETKTRFAESTSANNKTDLVNEVLSALDLSVNDVSDEVIITIKTVKDGYRRVIKEWEI